MTLIKKELQNAPSMLAIVEGKKDKNVLSELGFTDILAISGQSISAIVEKIKLRNPESVAILTDFDREGERKANALINILQKNKVLINFSIRRKIKLIFKVKKLEELKFFTKLLDHNSGDMQIHEKELARQKFYRKFICTHPRTKKLAE